ncbi:unnamed protein product [Ectocarpus sp. 12 AP-2014]
MSTTVTWTQDSISRYEISSKNHLIQLMNNGTLYTNAGSTPTDFMNVYFIQTVDIDLLSDPTNVKPIGRHPASFGGTYDGNNFKISNWSYLDPEFDATGHCEQNVGIFGYVLSGSTLKNIKLAGVCTIRGFRICAGMLVGSANTATIYNIDCNFSTGSFIEQGHSEDTFSVYAGGVIGKTIYGTVTAVQLRGEMDRITCHLEDNAEIGGIAGQLRYGVTTLLRNLATFKNTLAGECVGGLVGYSYDDGHTKSINAMTGDLYGLAYAGGMFGKFTQRGAIHVIGEVVNSMTGNITGNIVGGICGQIYVKSGGTVHSLMNYMRGNISSTRQNYLGVYENWAGGLIGMNYNSYTQLESSINAMKGDVYKTVVGADIRSGIPDLAWVDTSFGLTFTVDKYNTNTPVTGLAVDPTTNLPVVDLTTTDGDGVTHTYDFVFANYILFETVPRPLNVTVSFGEASGAIAYRLTVHKAGDDTSSARTVDTGFTDFSKNVTPLVPETKYVFRVYSTTDGSQYDLYLEGNETTLANASENYNVSDYADEKGRFDLSVIDATSSASVLKVAKDLFATGDSVIVSMKQKKATRKTTFVNLGDTISIVGKEAVLMPFEDDGGASQSAAISLSDDSSVTVAFDDTSGTIDFGGVTYSAGDYLVVDSLKLTFVEV